MLAFALLIIGLSEVLSLSCPPCGLSGPCQDPACCDSGFLVKDVCGCCMTCAKPQDDTCGGPFNSGGTCAQGLSCLRSCGCRTDEEEECVFPFVYKGQTYTKCTTAESANNKPWCATKVFNESNEVIRNQWGDCQEYCSDENMPNQCNLFNENGRCLDASRAKENLAIFTRNLGSDSAEIDEASSGSGRQEFILPCNDPFRTTPKNYCRCSNGETLRDLSGNIKGACNGQGSPGTFSVNDPDTIYGYCFVEHVEDPSNPSKNCFDDVQYSPADGRFYSFQACRDEFESGRIQN